MPPRRRRRQQINTVSLKERLVLHEFMCWEFGYRNMTDMLGHINGLVAEFDPNGESRYVQVLAIYQDPQIATVLPEQLAEYDANIAEHSRRLAMTGAQGRRWKPYQYLALLFTERYLDRWFADPEKLCDNVNRSKSNNSDFRDVPGHTRDDLHTLAFQSATGSGKTLIMHAHILQYQHYLARAGGRLNNVILLTPNEQLSRQHERELQESGLRARLFSTEAGADLFSHVGIIDLNKLAKKKGIKRVAVRDFGDNNLVLVDEGHLGASGKVWREHRRELSRGGFTFEYSATFNQIVSRNNSKELLYTYGKCLLFDYSYRQFHEDGYGKDYAISNLPGGMEDASSNTYLLGCLLSFYQQYRIWQEHGAGWQEFNVTKPLWVFLGKTVIGSGKADTETKSDVILILDFLGWVLASGDMVRDGIKRLLDGQSGLPDEAGNDYFAGRFKYLNQVREGDIYTELCMALFHGQGRLHIVYLTAGEGELHLRSADNPVFGVVNVGDSTGLHKLLMDKANPDISVDREAGFAQRLFATVDRQNSSVNVVIGARRFIAGWNSWRVSTMGLMHVGVGEGPEIIQMFGRGVRLKGWDMSLKRHRKSDTGLPQGSDDLAELETLYIFGLRANYMQTFRDLLEKEGVQVQRETIRLPVTWNFGRKTDLKLIRLSSEIKYERSDARVTLPPPDDENSPNVTLDLYSQLQSVASSRTRNGKDMEKTTAILTPDHTIFFNQAALYDRLMKRKRQHGWHNLTIAPQTIDRLLASDDWYELYAPPEKLQVTTFQQLRVLEDLAVDLITEYADQFWRKHRRRWEHDKIEVVTLDQNDPNNIREYELSMDARQDAALVRDIHTLAPRIRAGLHGDFPHLHFGAISANNHAYKPLLYADKKCRITIQPVALNGNEKKVVESLVALAANDNSCLQGRELYLIRNLSRGRGVSFFDDFAYYPDFIVWLKDDDHQQVIFLDPKGLVRYGHRERRKVALHTEIKEVEKRVHKTDPKLYLHAYVLSPTARNEIGDKARSQEEWEEKGVYFLEDPEWPQRVIGDAFESVP